MSGNGKLPLVSVVLLGIIIGAGAGAWGIAAASVDPSDGTAMPRGDEQVSAAGDPTKYSETLSSPGQGMAPGQAIDQVLESLGSTVVTDIELVAAPSSAPNADIPWVNVYVNGDANGPGAEVALTWVAALAHGAIADLMRTKEAATNDIIGGATVLVQSPSGERKELEGGIGYVSAGQVFDAQITEPSDSSINDHVSETVKRFGLTLGKVTVLHPLGPAVSVVAVLPSSSQVNWTIDDLREALSGQPRAYEGLSIEVDSADGKPLIVSSVAYRTGLGSLWYADGQDEVFGAIHGGTVLDK